MPKMLQKWMFLLLVTVLTAVPPLRSWSLTVAAALLLAALVRRLTLGLVQRGVPRWLAGAVLVSGAAAVLVGVGYLVVERLCCGAGQVSEVLNATQAARQGLDTLTAQLPKPMREAVSALRLLLEREGSALYGRLLRYAAQVGGTLAASLPRIVLRSVIIVVGSVYALSDWEHICIALLRCVPEDWRSPLRGVLSALGHGAATWLRAECTMAAVQFGILLVGFLLLGVEKVILTALFIALTDALPLVGAGAVLLPWAAVCLLTGDTVGSGGRLALWLLLWAARTTLEPRLLGRRAGTNAFTSLVVLYLGFECFGAVGLLAAPVVMAAVVNVVRGEVNEE